MKQIPLWLALAAAALAGCGANDSGLGLEAFVCTDEGTYTVEEGTEEGHHVIHRGKCGDPMTCDSVIDCFGGDECREMGDERTSPPYPGDVCVPVPWYCPCPGVLAPVCGADGQTYINECEAHCVRVRVIHEGRCKDDPKPRRCRTDEDCEPDQHCQYPGPIPLSTDPEAPCIEGEPCPPFGHGICVPDVALCYDDGDCPVGEICEHVLLRPTPPDGVCFPCACPEIYQPVCGVDGQTYGNRCEARCAHVEVAHEGQCESCPVTHVKTPDGRCEPKCYGDEQCRPWTVCNAPWVCLQDPACPECDVCVGWCESPDCRVTGCAEKESCQQCFVDWVCIPDGVYC